MTLSPRETQVAALIALGLHDKQIAARLSLAVDTVKMYVRKCLAKAGVGSRTELAAAWLAIAHDERVSELLAEIGVKDLELARCRKELKQCSSPATCTPS
jgi:DNA-binding CsgD family transcriptional regulator